MSKPDLCIYHGNCADGFTSAWAIWRRWPDVEFFPGIYGETPPDVKGKHVLLVDFSYKRPVLEAMERDALTITVLDHHKTAQADLAPFVCEALEDGEAFGDRAAFMGCCAIQARFDMDKSGAMLAWEYAHPGEPAPRLVQHVQDRDLWRFALEGTRQIQAAVFSHEYDFWTWDDLALDIEQDVTRANIIAQGEAIERKHFKDIGELLSATQRYMVIGGHRVPVANLPYTLASDAANQLAEGNPFAACYFDRADGQRVFSLRSKPEGLDVSLIAASYGGGGHARASGFQMPIGWEGEAA